MHRHTRNSSSPPYAHNFSQKKTSSLLLPLGNLCGVQAHYSLPPLVAQGPRLLPHLKTNIQAHLPLEVVFGIHSFPLLVLRCCLRSTDFRHRTEGDIKPFNPFQIPLEFCQTLLQAILKNSDTELPTKGSLTVSLPSPRCWAHGQIATPIPNASPTLLTTHRLHPSQDKNSATQVFVLISRPRTPDLAPELTTSFTAFFGPSSTTLRPGFRSPRENASCNYRARSASVPGEEGRSSPHSPSHASSADTYLSVCDKRFFRIRVRAGGQGSVHLAARTSCTYQRPGVSPGPGGWKRAHFAAAACLQPLPHSAAPRGRERLQLHTTAAELLNHTSASGRGPPLPVFRCYRNRSGVGKCWSCLGSAGKLPLDTRAVWWLGGEA